MSSNPPPPETIYSVGTLRYNQRELTVVFFWLMWNTVGFILVEDINTLNGVLMRDFGATFTQMALLGTIGGFITPFINPWLSTWSDRHRGPFGRRRPFLFATVPIYAVLAMSIPFMPDLFYFLQKFPVMARLLAYLPMNGPAFFIGICGLFSGLFNAAFLCIASYLCWDVIPENVMGRFNSIKGNIGLLVGLSWSFWIYGQAQYHMKAVYVGVGTISLVIYLVSVWMVKEGEYPPPDEHKKGGVLAPIRAYCVECFSERYYLWIFVASLFYQLGNGGGWYQFNWLHYDMKMELGTLGWVDGWAKVITTGFGLLLGFYVGAMTDRLKPVRLMSPIHLLLALVPLWGFFFIHDQWSYLTMVSVRSLVQFVQGIILGAFTVEIFPREKIGQFCSAQAMFYQFICNMSAPLVAMLFDWLKNNRLGFLWTAFFYSLAGLTYFKVYLNWKRRHGHSPTPHAG